VVQAITTTLIESARPARVLLGPVVDALGQAPPPTWDGLGRVAARCGSDGLEAVSAAALDREAPPHQRLGPIHALGAFHSRDAADHLTDLLEDDRHECLEIVQAACAALDRVTGCAFGPDRSRWIAWRAETRGLDDEAWSLEVLERLTMQRAQLETQLQDVAEQLHRAYERLFPALPYEGQVALLPELLEDELQVVRRFAIESLSRLARDRTIPPSLQRALAGRLDDESATLRLEAARLLDQLAYEKLPDAVAERLEREREPEIVRQYLSILSAQPSPRAVTRLCELIAEPPLAEPAAEALWSLSINDRTRAANAAISCSTLRAAYESAGTPVLSQRLARLLALLGDEGDVALLLEALDDPDPQRRAAVAAGLAHRGRKDPLVARAADETIYPFAVLAITWGEPSLARIQELLRLPPRPAQRQAWAEGIREVVGGLSPADVLVADDQLKGVVDVDPALRRDVLARVAALPPDALPDADRIIVLERLVPLHLALGEAPLAQALLEAFPLRETDPLAGLRLEAALRAQRYARAAELDGDPVAWIKVLERLAVDHADEARVLRDEIARRFAAQLVGDLRARFETATVNLPPTVPETATGTSGERPLRGASAGSEGERR
jgi:hypothetical protein